MKRLKILFICLCMMFFSLYLGGCSVKDVQGAMYNNNAKLVKEADSYSFNNDIENILDDKAELKFSSFYGDDTIWIMKADKDSTVDLNYDAKIDSGKFKIIFIDPDNKVTIIREGSGSSNITLNLSKGRNRIKIVGSSAKGEVDMKLKSGSGVIIK